MIISFSDRLVVSWTNLISWLAVSGFRSFTILIMTSFVDSFGFWFLDNSKCTLVDACGVVILLITLITNCY